MDFYPQLTTEDLDRSVGPYPSRDWEKVDLYPQLTTSEFNLLVTYPSLTYNTVFNNKVIG